MSMGGAIRAHVHVFKIRENPYYLMKLPYLFKRLLGKK